MENSKGFTYTNLKKALTPENGVTDLTNEEILLIIGDLKNLMQEETAAPEQEEFDQYFDLESGKQNEVSYKQIKFAEKLASKTDSELPNTSQMMKYCSFDTMQEIIDAMQGGKRIKLD